MDGHAAAVRDADGEAARASVGGGSFARTAWGAGGLKDDAPGSDGFFSVDAGPVLEHASPVLVLLALLQLCLCVCEEAEEPPEEPLVAPVGLDHARVLELLADGDERQLGGEDVAAHRRHEGVDAVDGDHLREL